MKSVKVNTALLMVRNLYYNISIAVIIYFVYCVRTLY